MCHMQNNACKASEVPIFRQNSQCSSNYQKFQSANIFKSTFKKETLKNPHNFRHSKLYFILE